MALSSVESQASVLIADVTIIVYVHRQCVCPNVQCTHVSSGLLSVEYSKDLFSSFQMILMCRPVVSTECPLNSVLGNMI